MNNTAPTGVIDFVATRPAQAIIKNLFTFSLVSGPVYRYTDWRLPITIGGNTYQPLKIMRGGVKLSRGTSIDSTEVKIVEANGAVLNQIRTGLWNRAVFLQQRVIAADTSLAWIGPVTRFFGRANDFKDIGLTSATITVKSMLVDLDNDFPRQIVQVDCDRVLFDAGCTVNRASYLVTGTTAAGSTTNKLLSGLSNADGYFEQGVVQFTSGAMSGLAYLVRSYVGGVVYPAYPLLTAPAAGDTFTITPGCDKTQATCSGKFGNLVNFPSMPFVPDPTVTYAWFGWFMLGAWAAHGLSTYCTTHLASLIT